MPLYGPSSRRLSALYDMDECIVLKYYDRDAHTTYTPDHESDSVSDITIDSLVRLLRKANNTQQLQYNEVALRSAGPVIGFALIVPCEVDELMIGAKRVAIQLQRYHPSTSIVVFNEVLGCVT